MDRVGVVRGGELGHTDVKHRQLSSLTPDEYQTVETLLLLLGAKVEDDGMGNLTLNVAVPVRNGFNSVGAVRIPPTISIDELIGWAKLLASG